MSDPTVDFTSSPDPARFTAAPHIARRIEETQLNKFRTLQGHGFAAEEANILSDQMQGYKVDRTGENNALNGPDRVTPVEIIQTKYCRTPTDTLNSAFKDNTYAYSGQILEVPKDQYDECLRLMREKIVQGQVPGVTNPEDAEKIIKKGSVTYQQARNIARAGNIDSLWFDAKTHAVTSTGVFALSFTISFARQKWGGVPTGEAIKASLGDGAAAGLGCLASGVLTSQLLRTKFVAGGVVHSRHAVKAAYKTKLGKTFISKLASASLGKTVGGQAAMNHVAKLGRTNVVSGTVSTVVMAGPDFYRAAFAKNISWKQFGKNVAINGAGVAGGAGGWAGGAIAGAAMGSVVPIIGTAAGAIAGGILGSLGGGLLASKGTQLALDQMMDDDAVGLAKQMPQWLAPLAEDFLLSEEEVKSFCEAIQPQLTGKFWKALYKTSDRPRFVYQSFEPACETLVKARPPLTMPSAEEVEQHGR